MRKTEIRLPVSFDDANVTRRNIVQAIGAAIAWSATASEVAADYD